MTRCNRSLEVQRGAAAGGEVDAETGGDRRRQERHRGGPGRRQAQVPGASRVPKEFKKS